MWSKCPKCGEVLYRRDLAANIYVCTRCSYHFRMKALRSDRVARRDGEFTEIGQEVLPNDPLGWSDQRTLSGEAERRSRAQRALRIGRLRALPTIGGLRIALGVMDFHFRGGHDGPRHRRAHHAAARGGAPPKSSCASSLRLRAARAWRRACSRSCRWRRRPPQSRTSCRTATFS